MLYSHSSCHLFVMQERRYKDCSVNRPVFNMKIKALKIMDLFFNYRFYIRLQVSFYICVNKLNALHNTILLFLAFYL